MRALRPALTLSRRERGNYKQLLRLAWGGLLLALFAARAFAGTPVISLIIDDLGDRAREGAQIVALPGPVACAFLPGTPHGAQLARDAHAQGKEVLLHFPLQPLAGKAHPRAITVRSDRGELARRLREDLAELPHLSGVNTHQGSLLSQRLPPMHWLMAELKSRGGLYFVDSYTSAQSVALRTAQAWSLQSARRDVFLDAARDAQAIRTQWNRLIAKARHEGSALGIGHPYPETIALLQLELPKLAALGVRLVAPSELIGLQTARRPPPQFPPLLLKLSDAIASADTIRFQ